MKCAEQGDPIAPIASRRGKYRTARGALEPALSASHRALSRCLFRTDA